MPGEYDINQMREEAVRRAREMQSRARFPTRPAHAGGKPPSAEASSPHSGKGYRPPQNETPSPPPQPESPRERPAKPELSPAGGKNGLLETLFQDKERTVLLALLLLLSEDDSHHDLMFALMFLLM